MGCFPPSCCDVILCSSRADRGELTAPITRSTLSTSLRAIWNADLGLFIQITCHGETGLICRYSVTVGTDALTQAATNNALRRCEQLERERNAAQNTAANAVREGDLQRRTLGVAEQARHAGLSEISPRHPESRRLDLRHVKSAAARGAHLWSTTVAFCDVRRLYLLHMFDAMKHSRFCCSPRGSVLKDCQLDVMTRLASSSARTAMRHRE